MIAVHQTTRLPATQPMAAWLANMLYPVARAARIASPPPLEIRPTGWFGGWCSDADHAPDGRISVSSKIVFWTRESIISLYLHESAHRLLESQNVQHHGPQFFCLNAVLLLRSAQSFDADPLFKLDLYDCQDRCIRLEKVAEWRTLQIEWALAEAAKLAATDLTAEACAAEVCKRWTAHIDRLRAEELSAIKKEANARELVAQLRGSVLNWRLASLGLAVLFFLLRRGIS
jgi:hypothetical protein